MVDAGSAQDAAREDAAAPDSTSDAGGIVLGAPITAPTDTWTWVDFPDTYCDDGSPTGLAVRTSSSGSNNLLIFLTGGGACWDATTCLQLNTATHGPFGQAQFDVVAPTLNRGIYDRTNPNNAFKAYNYVFIPYCTGDLFSGSNIAMYTPPGGGAARPYYHVGHNNVVAYFERLAPTFPNPGRLVISGSSAGGLGATLNYDAARTSFWPNVTRSYLINDSGPFLSGSVTPSSFVADWIMNWHIDALTDPICGQACHTDPDQFFASLANAFPHDRMGLLESLQDDTVRQFLLLTGPQFQAALLSMAQMVLDPLPNFKYFFVPGQTHTMLGDPGAFTSSVTALPTWLDQEIGDDPAWKSTKP
jgi:hypothetical protein